MSTVRPNLQSFAMIREENSDCIASTGFAVLTAKPNVSSNYLYHCLFGREVTAQIEGLVVGSNYPAINSSDVASLKVLCPPFNEQVIAARILDEAEAITANLRAQLGRIVEERAALMQQLLAGERRITQKREAA